MTKQLVCEGACNPQRLQVDAAVKAFRARTGRVSGDGMDPIPDYLASRLHTLRHTGHDMVAEGVARCQTCGAERAYGYSLYAAIARQAAQQ